MASPIQKTPCLNCREGVVFWSVLRSSSCMVEPVSVGKIDTNKRLNLGLAAGTRWPVMRHIADSHLCRLLPRKDMNPGFVNKSAVLNMTNCVECDWSIPTHFVFTFLNTLYFVRVQSSQELHVGICIVYQSSSGLTN